MGNGERFLKTVLLWEMTWEEVSKRLPNTKAVIIPVGSTEQHGLHLPLQHDAASALFVAKMTAEKLYPKVIVAPPITVGVSPMHLRFPGTLALRPETLINVVYDICKSLRNHGFKKIVILNGHGNNAATLKVASFKIKYELGLTLALLDYWDVIPQDVANSIIESDRTPLSAWPGHSCEFETSIAYVMYPRMVRQKAIRKSEEIQYPSYQRFLARNIMEHPEVKTGIPLGDPTLATPEKGRKLVQAIVTGLVSFLESFIAHGDEL